MKSSIIAASTLFVAAVIAQPHGHQHQKHHEKRDIVYETEIEIITETIPITTTIWVNEDEIPATTSPSATSSATPAEFYETHVSVSLSTSTTPTPTPTPTPTSTTLSTSSTSTPPPPPPPSTSSVSVAAPSVAAQAPKVSVAAAAKPVTTSTTPAPVIAPTPTTSTSAYVAPTSPASPLAAPTSASSGSGSSSGGQCSAGNPCTGDITYYTAGLGACGDITNGDNTRVVALPYGLMGTQSNGNPYCGKTITVTKGDKKTIAIVADKCMGCEGMAIDLSDIAFGDLADFAVGRTTATWWFN